MEQDAFVIIDVRNTMLHLVRTDTSLVVSLNQTDIKDALEILGVVSQQLENLGEVENLVWAAVFLASGAPPDAETLNRLVERSRMATEDEASISLRYRGTDPLTLVLRRKTG